MFCRQNRSFKSRFLAVLLLFFNCVCIAAPVLRLDDGNYNDAVSIQLGQIPNPLESEEETHAPAFSYINYVNHFSARKYFGNRVYNPAVTRSNVLLPAVDLSNTCILNASTLPMPGNDAFLFRYTLF